MSLNRHATVVVIGDRGVMIGGVAGSGKTGLALALLAHAAAIGRFVRLVADDRVFLDVVNGRLIARAPASIAGLAEVRGPGPQQLRYEPSAVVDLGIELVERAAMERLQEPRWDEICGCRVPALDLAAHDVPAALAAVSACLKLPPFA